MLLRRNVDDMSCLAVCVNDLLWLALLEEEWAVKGEAPGNGAGAKVVAVEGCVDISSVKAFEVE